MGDWENDFDIILDRAVEHIEADLPGALLKAAEHVRGVAAGLTPVETGNLVGEASAQLLDPMTAEVLYPGPYARNQHYSLDFRHTHGQALFLEQPVITEAPAVLRIIADGISE